MSAQLIKEIEDAHAKILATISELDGMKGELDWVQDQIFATLVDQGKAATTRAGTSYDTSSGREKS